MGLRDLFRSSKNTAPTPQPSPGRRPSDPAAERAAEPTGTGAPGQAVAAQDAERRRPEAAVAPLPESGALRHLVEILLSRGAQWARLTLVQSGNIMTHQTRSAVGLSGPRAEGDVENGTVDQGSPLFDDVAELYTQAMSTPVGPWRQLDLEVAAPRDGVREITVTYDFPNGESRVEHYAHGTAHAAGHSASDEAGRDGMADDASPHETASPAVDGAEAGHEHTAAATGGAALGGAAVGAGLAAAGTHEPAADAAETPQDDAVRVVEDGDVVAGAEHAAPVVTEASTTEAAAEDDAAPGTADAVAPEGFDAQDGRDLEDGAETVAEDPFATPVEVQEAGTVEDGAVTETVIDETAVPAEGVAIDEPSDTEVATTAPEEHDAAGSDDLPAHVDESEFGTATGEPLLPAAAGAAGEDEDLSDAPQLAAATDVAPSYRGSDREGVDLSALAPGNLVLTTGDVLGRLAGAQRHLFGPEGSAREVSTVLIRVRALGTYYDALTHVRLNGFWDQRATFDLVPEELLKVQELKDDSYVEGSGAPLAMMFRFRPGLPPEVTFDYSDEEAFVRYEQRLPGQNYLEELRMYPRTGSNIPQHVNEALQDWNY
ncbi:hypothetical protein KVA01_05110 [Kocuria varians]|uniref:Uncharacterized protein n=1 Tax=Kocuria varians TaxID=1272 RepID=A0A4Y4D188_KOCVA|nr:hypothetical protein KVA01_05110 [Kocuria varians]